MGRKIERINIEEMVKMLPTEPDEQMVSDLLVDHMDEGLGGQFMIFRRVPVIVEPDLKHTMCAADWEDRKKNTVHRWGASCTCTFCYDTFQAGYWKKGKERKGIRLFMGEDGVLYDGYCDEMDTWNTQEFEEGEGVVCPICGASVKLVSASSMKGGKTYWVRMAGLENVGEYTAVLYWTAQRYVDRYGGDGVSVEPWQAIVIDKNGRLERFAYKYDYYPHQKGMGTWRYVKAWGDPFQSGEDRCYLAPKTITWWVHINTPDLAGKTGEKTGIDLYMKNAGMWPAVYLQTWREHPQIENLLKAGWVGAVDSGIEYEVNDVLTGYPGGYLKAAKLRWVDWDQVKPHRMLHMAKEDHREIHRDRWKAETVKEWLKAKNYCNGREFDRWLFDFGLDNLTVLREQTKAGAQGYEYRKVINYCYKQNTLLPRDAMEQLIDSREMAMQITGRTILTNEELWPRDLEETHERLIGLLGVTTNPVDRLKFSTGFKVIKERYRALEWNDGNLCIILPTNNGELITEGATLRHCVGG